MATETYKPQDRHFEEAVRRLNLEGSPDWPYNFPRDKGIISVTTLAKTIAEMEAKGAWTPPDDPALEGVGKAMSAAGWVPPSIAFTKRLTAALRERNLLK